MPYYSLLVYLSFVTNHNKGHQNIKTFRTLIGLILFTLLVIGITCAQSQPPSPSTWIKNSYPQIPTKNVHQKPQDNKSGTYNLSFTIKKTKDTPENKASSPHIPNKESEETSSIRWTAMFTGVLAAVALLQLIIIAIQACLLYKSIKIAKDASHAFQASERAYVFVTVGIPAINHFPVSQPNSLDITFTIKNHGRTPAILKRMWLISKTKKPGSYPTKDEIMKEPPYRLPSKIINSNNQIIEPLIFIIETTDDWKQIEIMEVKLLCYGIIEYKDMFNQSRVTGFCWEYYPRRGEGERIDISDNQELNYNT